MRRWLALLLASVPLLSTPSRAGDETRERARLERRTERRGARTETIEEKWISACAQVEIAPEDERVAKSRARVEDQLIHLRARWIGVSRRLDALGEPAADVRVLYATNRERWTRAGEWYRARDADRVEYGVATVHIPEDHPAGDLESGLEVTFVEVLDEAAFRDELAHALEAAGPDAGVLLTVHGYNNSFAYAARRSAQLAHDLDVPLVPVMFSWPAHGGTSFASAKYTFDENAAARAAPLFADVLGELLDASGDHPVSLFAHSMGSRVVSDALLDLDRHARLDRPLAQVVLAAPDIDASLFERRYLDLVVDAAERLTVYCASDDRALKLSRGVHGGYDRLGSCRQETLERLARGKLEIVDASRLYVNLLEHDKVTGSPRLISDLRLVLAGVPAGDPVRKLVSRPTYHELPP